MSLQHTLGRVVALDGCGLHTGARVRVELAPGEVGTGVVFSRQDRPGEGSVRAHLDAVLSTHLATTIGNGQWQIGTVEHLLAALCGEGIDNVQVRVTGPEVAVLDGSAAGWVELIRQAGRVSQNASRKVMVIEDRIEISHRDRVARLLPCSRLEVSARIHFDNPHIGEQRFDFALDNGAFGRELAWARTFGFVHEVDALRERGLILGGSLDNAVVFGADGVLNPGGLRCSDEPVRHKVLDMLGDLALVGYSVRGRFEADLPGHALTRALVAELLRRSDAWSVHED